MVHPSSRGLLISVDTIDILLLDGYTILKSDLIHDVDHICISVIEPTSMNERQTWYSFKIQMRRLNNAKKL